jgi:hypothetical protein
MSRPQRITYAPRNDASSEAAVLAQVYKLVLDCHAKKRGRLPDKSGPDARKENLNASGKPSIPRAS